MGIKIVQGLYSLALVLFTAIASKYFTDIGLNNFYSILNLPEVTPENSYFRIIWRWLYFLLFLSLSKKTAEEFNEANSLFISQLFLQILWCFSFFFMGQMSASAIVIVLLFMEFFLMWRSFFVINKWAGAILIPYFVWIMFACFLNINIANMN